MIPKDDIKLANEMRDNHRKLQADINDPGEQCDYSVFKKTLEEKVKLANEKRKYRIQRQNNA